MEEQDKYVMAHEQRFARIEERIKKSEGEIDVMQDCVSTLTVIQGMLETTIAKHDNDIDELKNRRTVQFDKFVGYLLSATVGGIVVYLLKSVGLG